MTESMWGGYKCSRIPAHGYSNVDWKQNDQLLAAPHKGAATSYTYMPPVSKYVEAYAMGPVWNDFTAYRVGNQPYNYKDSIMVAYHTPAQPNHLTLVNSAPRYSSAGVQQAQVTMGQLLASRAPGVGL